MIKRKVNMALLLMLAFTFIFSLLGINTTLADGPDGAAANDVTALTGENIKGMSSQASIDAVSVGQASISPNKTNTLTTGKFAPAVPDISADSVITITPGKSVIGYEDIPSSKLEDCEDAEYQFEKQGNWFLTSDTAKTGRYSLRSDYVREDSLSECQFSVDIPKDAVNPTVSFDWTLSGQAQNDYFYVGLDDEWLWSTTDLINKWYTVTMNLVPGKTNVVKFAFYKKEYNSVGLNGAFVDDIKVSYINRKYEYGDVQKAQYRINNSVWKDYTASLSLGTMDNVTIAARTIDKNGMFSSEVSKTLSAGSDPLLYAAGRLEELEKLLSDLSTQQKVDNAQNAYNQARNLVNNSPNSLQKTVLTERLDKAQTIINIARTALKVQAAENACMVLNTRALIDQAKALYGDVLQTVNALGECQQKTALLERLNAVIFKIDIAQVELKVKAVEASAADMSTQALIGGVKALYADALESVNALTECAEKQVFAERLKSVLHRIEFAKADLLISNAENLASELTTWESCDAAQTARDIAQAALNSLAECTGKTAFTERVNSVQLRIDIRRAVIKVEAAENSITQVDLSVEQQYIDKLPSISIRTELQERINFIQKVIDAAAQVEVAQRKYTAAETTLLNGKLTSLEFVIKLKTMLSQAKAEADKAAQLVKALPATDKTVLAKRIQSLKETIEKIQGLIKVSQQIIDESSGHFRLNGYERRQFSIYIKMSKGTTVNLISLYSEFLKQELKAVDNLRVVSFDTSNITVKQNGDVTSIRNGLCRVVVYNENGKLDFYVISIGRRK